MFTPVSARISAVLPWSMWPAVPSVSGFIRASAPCAARTTSGTSFLGQRARVEQHLPVVRCARSPAARASRSARASASGSAVERHRRSLELEQRQRPAAHAAHRRARSAPARRSPARSAAPAPPASHSAMSSMASTGISRTRAVGVAVQPERRLERGQRQLVDAQRARQRMPARRRHGVAPAHDQPRLRDRRAACRPSSRPARRRPPPTRARGGSSAATASSHALAGQPASPSRCRRSPARRARTAPRPARPPRTRRS